MSAGFHAAMEELASTRDTGADLTAPILQAIPLTGASVSTLGGILEQETVASSDATAARVDELQFDLGEGPCWDVVATGRPVFEPAIRARPGRGWPAFIEAIRREPVGALFAFPLSIGTLHFGALDLYHRDAATLTDEQARQAEQLAGAISRYVFRRALRIAGEPELEVGRHSRRTVHQATGFVIAQLGLSPEDATMLIQGQALVQGRSMTEIAQDIVDRRLTFTADDGRIEEEEGS